MNKSVRKITVAAMIVALTVSLSTFSIPIGASRCFPIQHLMNVLASAFLGPIYAVSCAFLSSLIRNLMGTGSLLAFPGSMVGAFVASLLYQKWHNISFACVGEVIGTGILGAMLCYPIATVMMGKEAALFTYVVPFLVSTAGGTIFAFVLLQTLAKAKVLDLLQVVVNGENR